MVLSVFFQLGQGSGVFDVGERRRLKVAVGDKLLLQANAVAVRKHFVNGELVEVKGVQGDSILLADGRIIPRRIYRNRSRTAMPSLRTPPRARRRMKCWLSHLRVRCPLSTGSNSTSAFRVGASVAGFSPMIATCSARTSRIPARGWPQSKPCPVPPQLDLLQTILQRGNRFLKQFRQRLAQAISTERSIHEIKPIESQRKSFHLGV